MKVFLDAISWAENESGSMTEHLRVSLLGDSRPTLWEASRKWGEIRFPRDPKVKAPTSLKTW